MPFPAKVLQALSPYGEMNVKKTIDYLTLLNWVKFNPSTSTPSLYLTKKGKEVVSGKY